MLTIRQEAIKKYVRERHAIGFKITIQNIARAFDITHEDVRSALVAIRRGVKSRSTNLDEAINNLAKAMGLFK